MDQSDQVTFGVEEVTEGVAADGGRQPMESAGHDVTVGSPGTELEFAL